MLHEAPSGVTDLEVADDVRVEVLTLALMAARPADRARPSTAARPRAVPGSDRRPGDVLAEVSVRCRRRRLIS